MFRIGILGCGKLGLPIAVSFARKFPVWAYDMNVNLCQHRVYEHKETGPDGKEDFQPYFNQTCQTNLKFAQCPNMLVKNSDIIFVAVQTPHEARFEGSTPLPSINDRADFNYSHLIEAVRSIAPLVKEQQTVVIISTVLPGTMRREILPLLKNKCKVIYNPFFIAMGTVMKDFSHPEFVLIGREEYSGHELDLQTMYNEFYSYKASQLCMSIESAELTKVAYNCFISSKIVIANTFMELAHKIPNCNCDDVTKALGSANDRLMSPKYLRGGMSDGGGCHPRDNIAMSWLCNKLGLDYNLFDDIMLIRERQAEWLVDLLCEHGEGLPKVILGKAFKEETNITTGSPAFLCAEFLKRRGEEYIHYDLEIDGGGYNYRVGREPVAILIATRHKLYFDMMQAGDFPKGSVIVDPWRYLPKHEGVKLISVGIGETNV